MSSFGHVVRVLVDRDEAGGWRRSFGSEERCRAGARKGKTGCRELAIFICEYSYVTGRAGRVTTNRKARCRIHAQMFANKHQVAGPDELAVEDLQAVDDHG